MKVNTSRNLFFGALATGAMIASGCGGPKPVDTVVEKHAALLRIDINDLERDIKAFVGSNKNAEVRQQLIKSCIAYAAKKFLAGDAIDKATLLDSTRDYAKRANEVTALLLKHLNSDPDLQARILEGLLGFVEKKEITKVANVSPENFIQANIDETGFLPNIILRDDFIIPTVNKEDPKSLNDYLFDKTKPLNLFIPIKPNNYKTLSLKGFPELLELFKGVPKFNPDAQVKVLEIDDPNLTTRGVYLKDSKTPLVNLYHVKNDVKDFDSSSDEQAALHSVRANELTHYLIAQYGLNNEKQNFLSDVASAQTTTLESFVYAFGISQDSNEICQKIVDGFFNAEEVGFTLTLALNQSIKANGNKLDRTIAEDTIKMFLNSDEHQPKSRKLADFLEYVKVELMKAGKAEIAKAIK